ncbi:MAG TPA: hypothetical protein VGI54_05660 [Solirubrobacteraceae bacterium]
MLLGVAHTDHPEVREIVPTPHCLQRFRRRRPVHAPGGTPVEEELLAVLADCDVSRWPPAWAVSDRPATWWATSDGLAFPLAPASPPGRWLAVTCLRRDAR